MRRNALLFLGIPVLLILLVEIVPMIGVLWLSFTSYNPLDAVSLFHFVGLDNYARLVTDSQFWHSLWNTIFFGLMYVPIAVFGALLAAILLNQKIRGRSFIRGVFFLPVILSWVVAATMMAWFLDPTSGLASILSQKLGFGQLPYLLQDESTAMPTIAFLAIWKYFGYNTVIYLAGLQAVDFTLDEAAMVDGANAVQRFWYVTVPGIRGTTAIVLMLNLIQALRVFDPMMIMTSGGPNFSTTSTVLYFYRTAWDSMQFGYGSAITVALSIVIFAVAGFQFWFFDRRAIQS